MTGALGMLALLAKAATALTDGSNNLSGHDG
jgi:hypothetical protein